MKDKHLPPPKIERAAKAIDPWAWSSCDTQAGAFELRYRRYYARAKAGWPNEHYPSRQSDIRAYDRGVVRDMWWATR